MYQEIVYRTQRTQQYFYFKSVKHMARNSLLRMYEAHKDSWDMTVMRTANWKNPLCPVRPMGSNWGAVMTRYKPSITISIQSVDFNLSVNSEYFHQLWVLLIRSIPLYPARPVGSSWRVVIIRYRIPAIIRSTWDKKVNRVQSTGYSSIANRLAIKREWFHPALPNLSWSDHHGSVCANIR